MFLFGFLPWLFFEFADPVHMFGVLWTCACHNNMRGGIVSGTMRVYCCNVISDLYQLLIHALSHPFSHLTKPMEAMPPVF